MAAPSTSPPAADDLIPQPPGPTGPGGGSSSRRISDRLQPWNCPTCTYANSHDKRKCRVCKSQRPKQLPGACSPWFAPEPAPPTAADIVPGPSSVIHAAGSSKRGAGVGTSIKPENQPSSKQTRFVRALDEAVAGAGAVGAFAGRSRLVAGAKAEECAGAPEPDPPPQESRPASRKAAPTGRDKQPQQQAGGLQPQQQPPPGSAVRSARGPGRAKAGALEQAEAQRPAPLTATKGQWAQGKAQATAAATGGCGGATGRVGAGWGEGWVLTGSGVDAADKMVLKQLCAESGVWRGGGMDASMVCGVCVREG